jgi:hypothetical protein
MAVVAAAAGRGDSRRVGRRGRRGPRASRCFLSSLRGRAALRPRLCAPVVRVRAEVGPQPARRGDGDERETERERERERERESEAGLCSWPCIAGAARARRTILRSLPVAGKSVREKLAGAPPRVARPVALFPSRTGQSFPDGSECIYDGARTHLRPLPRFPPRPKEFYVPLGQSRSSF